MFVAVALAGGIGAVARALVDGAGALWGHSRYPRSTVIINLSGSALMGLLAGIGTNAVAAEWQTIVGVGFLGGYTTFSTAAVQAAEMVLQKKWGRTALYGVGMLVAAVVAAAVGMWVGIALTGVFFAGGS